MLGTVVGTAQRAAREIPKYVQQKVNNVAGTYERARQRADANAPSGGMTTNPRSREFSHGNQGGKPAPMKPMRNPGFGFGSDLLLVDFQHSLILPFPYQIYLDRVPLQLV